MTKMLLYRLIGCLLLLLAAYPADSLARGNGHNTVFDPNSMGGGWTCFTTNNCGGATAANFGATCDGIANDDDAVTAWTTYAVAQNPALVKLYIPPGSNCNVFTNGAITFCCGYDQALTGTPIKNMIVWAYRATFNGGVGIGGSVYHQDAVSQALINTVSAGATSVVVNDGNVGLFSAADWIMVTGDCTQEGDGGYPPNFQFYDTRQITGISGNTISFSEPLTNDYKSTWPVCSLAHVGSGGPAKIFLIDQTWDSDVTIYGLIAKNPGSAINIVARKVELIDFQVYDDHGTSVNTAPSGNKIFRALYSRFGGGFEIDKTIENLYLGHIYSYGAAGGMQSASPSVGSIEYTIFSCAMGGSSANKSLTLSHVTIPPDGCAGRLVVGGTVPFGAGNVLNIDNTVSVDNEGRQQENLVSDFTSYSAGTFTFPKSGCVGAFCVSNWFAQFVPGFSQHFNVHNGAGGNSCSPNYSWKVLDISEDVSSYIATTTNWKQDGSPIATPSTMPSFSCGGTALVTSYPFATVNQGSNVSPGVTQYAAPP